MYKEIGPIPFISMAILILILSVSAIVWSTDNKEPDPIWEKVNKTTYRMEVEGGWIYETMFDGKKDMVFVPKIETITGKL